MHTYIHVFPVVFPEKAGNQFSKVWIPAFAAMTECEDNYETINNYNRYLCGVKENAIRSFWLRDCVAIDLLMSFRIHRRR